MAKSFLIIDGYNLMHAAGLARAQYGPGDLERCRNKLLRSLHSQLSAEERKRTTIVFDAWDPPPGRERAYDFGGMRIQFADAPGEADAVIEALIDRHSAPKQVTVVSGDRRLQSRAKQRKSRCQDSETWYEELARRCENLDEEQASPSPRQRKLTDQETDYWLGVFGDVDDITGGDHTSPQQDLPDIVDEEYFG